VRSNKTTLNKKASFWVSPAAGAQSIHDKKKQTS
jgi:hypothetical protein